MSLAVLIILCVLLLLVCPALLAGRRFGMARAFGALGVSLIISGFFGLINPFWDPLTVKTALGLSLLAWLAWILCAPESWSSFMDFLMGNAVSSGLVILLLSTVAPFGNLEWLSFYATNTGLIEYHTPMDTRRMGGVQQDWREYLVSDTKRMQDPVLFWRPKAGIPPFNSQGFKTTIEMEVPKPANVFRIMAYGDSNTEGSETRDWSMHLQKMLQARNTPEQIFEVINAGVGGYSSYQGAQRFLQEWEVYEPDLVLVSFGWNDLPEAIEHSDKTYKPKSKVLVRILRALVHYRSYLAIQHYVVSAGLEQKKKEASPRVSLDDYLENMAVFTQVGRAQGFPVVYLTRPYRAPTSKMLAAPNWRSKVPAYNEALSTYAQSQGGYLIDVQKYFEQETQGLFADETHFTEEGRVEMARLLIRNFDLQGLLEINRSNPSADRD